VLRIGLRANTSAAYVIDAARDTAAVTIRANDFMLNFARARQSVPESAGAFDLNVRLSHALDADFSGRLAFAAAATHGAARPDDYAANAAFSIAAGATTAAIRVSVADDNAYEFDETAGVTLLPDDARDVGVGALGRSVIFILDDDAPSIALSIDNGASMVTLAEGDAAVLRARILPLDVDLRQRGIDFAGIRIVAGSDADAATRDALAPADFAAPVVTYNPGVPRNKRVSAMLQTADDAIHEGDEVFVASLVAESLRAADGGILFAAPGKERVVVTIADADAPPVVALRLAPESILDDRAAEVTLTATSAQPAGYNTLTARIPVRATLMPPTAAAAIADFVMEIPPGMQSASRAFTVTPAADVGGAIAFAITDAIQNAAPGAGATLAINLSPAQLQMGAVVAQNGAPITETNHLVFVPLSLSRDVDEDVSVRITAKEKDTQVSFLPGAAASKSIVFAAAEDATQVRNVPISLAGADRLTKGGFRYINQDPVAVLRAQPVAAIPGKLAAAAAATEVVIADQDGGVVRFILRAGGNLRTLPAANVLSQFVEGGNSVENLYAVLGNATGTSKQLQVNKHTTTLFFAVSHDPAVSTADAADWGFAAQHLPAKDHQLMTSENAFTNLIGPAPFHIYDDDLVEANETIVFGMRARQPIFSIAALAPDAPVFGDRFSLAPGRSTRTVKIVDNDTAALAFNLVDTAHEARGHAGQADLAFSASLDMKIQLPAQLGGKLVFTAAASADIQGGQPKHSAVTLEFTDADGDGILSGDELQARSLPFSVGQDHFPPEESTVFEIPGLALAAGHPLRARIQIGKNPRVLIYAGVPLGSVAFGRSDAARYVYQHDGLAAGQVPEAARMVKIPVTVISTRNPGNKTLSVFFRVGTAQPPRAEHQHSNLALNDFSLQPEPARLDFDLTDFAVSRATSERFTQMLTLAITPDGRTEHDENILLEIADLQLNNAPTTQYRILHGGVTSLTIVDDDAARAQLILPGGLSATAVEGADSVSLHMVLDRPAEADIAFAFAVRAPTAAAAPGQAGIADWYFQTADGARHDPASERMVFRVDAGQTQSKLIAIHAEDDSFREGDESAAFASAAGAGTYGLEFIGQSVYDVSVRPFTLTLADNENSAFRFYEIGTVRENAGSVAETLTLLAPPETATTFRIALDAAACGGVTLRTRSEVAFARGETEKAVRFDIADDDRYEDPQVCGFTITAPSDARYHNDNQRTLYETIRITDDDSRAQFAAAQCATATAALCTMRDMPADSAVVSARRVTMLEVAHTDTNGNPLPALGDILLEYHALLGEGAAAAVFPGSARAATMRAGQSSVSIPMPPGALSPDHIGKTLSVLISRASVADDSGGASAHEVRGELRTVTFRVVAPPPLMALSPLAPAYMDEHRGARTYPLSITLSHAFAFASTAQLSVRRTRSTFFAPDSACAIAARGVSAYRAAVSADLPGNAAATDDDARFDITFPAGTTTRTVNLTITPFNDACDNNGSGIITISLLAPQNAALAGGQRAIYVIDDDRRDLRVIYAHTPLDTPEREKARAPGSRDTPPTFIIAELGGEAHTPFPLEVSLSRAPNEREGALRVTFALHATGDDGRALFYLDEPGIAFEFPPAVNGTKHLITARAHNARISAGNEHQFLGILIAAPRALSSPGIRYPSPRIPPHSAVLRLQKDPGTVRWILANASVPRGARVYGPLGDFRLPLVYHFESLSTSGIGYLVPLAFGGDAVRGVDYQVRASGRGGPLCEYDGVFYIRASGLNGSVLSGLTGNFTFLPTADPKSKYLTLQLGIPGGDNDGVILDGSSGVPPTWCPYAIPQQDYGKFALAEPNLTRLRIYRNPPVQLSLAGGGTVDEGDAVARFTITANAASPVEKRIPLVLSGDAAQPARTFEVTLPAGQTRLASTFGIADDNVEGDEALTLSFGGLDTADSGYAPNPDARSLAYTIIDDDAARFAMYFPGSGGTAEAGENAVLMASLLPRSGQGGIDVGRGGQVAVVHRFANTNVPPVAFTFTDSNGDGLIMGGDEARATHDWTVLGGETMFAFVLESPPASLRARQFPGLPLAAAFTGRDQLHYLQSSHFTHQLDEGSDITNSALPLFARRAQSGVDRIIPLRLNAARNEVTPAADLSDFYGSPEGAPRITFGAGSTRDGGLVIVRKDGIVEGDEMLVFELDDAHADWPRGYTAGNPPGATFTIIDADQATLSFNVSKPRAWAKTPSNPNSSGTLEIFAQLSAPGGRIKVDARATKRIAYSCARIGTVTCPTLSFPDSDNDGFLSGAELRRHSTVGPAKQKEFFGDKETIEIAYRLSAGFLPENLSPAQFTATHQRRVSQRARA